MTKEPTENPDQPQPSVTPPDSRPTTKSISPVLKSWLEDVIVPILVKEILNG
jgi:hypothetical protein